MFTNKSLISRLATFSLLSGSLFFFTACEKRIDGSNEETVKESIQEIMEDLSEDDGKEFAASCLIIAMDGGLEGTSYKKLDGKTSKEVNAMAASIKERRKMEEKQRERERITQEIQQLTEKISTLREQEENDIRNAEQRRKVVISGAIFSKEKDMFRESPVIAFTIQNKSTETLSSIVLEAVLTSTGRKVPWVKDVFRYSFPGGLNPGEEQHLKLSPNMFSDWGSMKNRSDYNLNLTLKEAADENGETLWRSYENASKEREECEARLSELQASL